MKEELSEESQQMLADDSSSPTASPPIHTCCKGPNAATHDQEVDETQAAEYTDRKL